ncbi:MAG: UPF0175 family protein [Candidatus Electrothrix sp. YB6]
MHTYQIELPETAFSSLRKTPAEFIREMKYAAVVNWYETGRISQDKAAEIAELSRYEVSTIQLTPEILAEELHHARGKNHH